MDQENPSDNPMIQNDNVDAIPNTLHVGALDVCVLVFSICSYVFDIFMDLFIAYYYYSKNQMWYFSLTLMFVVVPSIVMTLVSLRWYINDTGNPMLPVVSLQKWILRICLLILQLGPVLRYVDSLVYAVKCYQSVDPQVRFHYYSLMVFEDADAALLRLFESFMESAPQLLIQLHFLLGESPDLFKSSENIVVCLKILAILSSLVSLSWSQTSYQRANRFCDQRKRNISICGLVIQTIWHFLTLASRVQTLALFASTYGYWIFVVLTAHWTLMTAWLMVQKTAACSSRVEELFFDAVVGFAYIFCYFNVKDTRTRIRYVTYYGVMLVENTLLILLWFVRVSDKLWLHQLVFAMHYCLFFSGIACMLVYYQCFHPNRKSLSIGCFRNCS